MRSKMFCPIGLLRNIRCLLIGLILMGSTDTQAQEIGGPIGLLLYRRCWLFGRLLMASTGTHAQQNGLSNRIAPLQKMLVGRQHFDGEY